MKLWAVAALVLLAGCGADRPTTVQAQSQNEMVFVAEVARAAAALGVNARGEITDYQYMVPCMDGTKCPAAGWWEAPVAYGWRPWINEQSEGTVMLLARHETCHALFESEEQTNECARKL